MSPVVHMRSTALSADAVKQTYTRTQVPQIDLRTLYGNLLQLAETEEQRDQFLARLLEYALSVTNGLGGAYFIHNPHRGLMLGPRMFSSNLLGGPQNPQSLLIEQAKSCAQSGQTLIVPHTEDSTAIIVPVSVGEKTNEVLSIIVDAPRQQVHPFVTALQLIAGYVNLKDKCTQVDNSSWEAQASAELIELIGHLHAEKDPRALGFTMVNELHSMMQAHIVFFGQYNPLTGRYQIKAISGLTEQDQRTELVRAMESLCAETAIHQATLVHPQQLTPGPGFSDKDTTASASRCSKVVAELLNSETVISSPMTTDNDKAYGVIACVFKDSTHIARQRNRLSAYAPALGGCLQRLSNNRASYRLKTNSQSKYGTWALCAALIAIVAAMFIPVQHRIKSDVVIETIASRHIAAQFDGVIEQVLVKPGDAIQRGDLLAKLDGRELKFQLEALRAEMARISKQRDIASAEGDMSAVQLATTEAERIASRVKLVELNQTQLDVISPIAGSIVSGDLARMVGSPVRRGQALFEVAPLSDLLVEIAIPAQDIAYIHTNANASVELEAYSGESITTQLDTIQPRSEIRDGENVFIAESKIPNRDNKLRPGMRGVGRIDGDQRSLGWVLFHSAAERISLWLGLGHDSNEA